MGAGQSDVVRIVAAVAAIGLVTLLLAVLGVSNTATVATTYLMVVLLAAATSSLRVAVVTSVAAMLSLNFFFLPPIGTFTVSDTENWVALAAFVAVSLVASNLSAVARARTREAVSRRDELARLFDLSRDVLLITDSRDAMPVLARSIARRFDLDFVAVALPRDGGWDVCEAGERTAPLDTRQLSSALAAAQASVEFDAHARTYAGHRTIEVGGRQARLVPLRVGAKPIGVLAAAGRPVEPGTLDALAGVVAIAVERATFLEQLKIGERARQEEQLKTALLASLGHDLRTPLTAISVAASNLKDERLSPADRVDQADIVASESHRLMRLFENLLDMARIDAGAVSATARSTHPSEIVAAAREQVAHALDRHVVEASISDDTPVILDPRLTATALAHLLENAAHYTPPGTTVELTAGRTPDGLLLQVRDRGPGIAPDDLPHLFERFYRGHAAKAARTSGTGMGLWIVRGLLAAVQGRVWAENRPDGGAQFTIVVPAKAADS